MIDEDDEIEFDEDDARLEGVEIVKDILSSRRTQTRAILRTVRRMEELDVAVQEAPKTGRRAKMRQRDLVETFEDELRTYELLKATRPEWA